MRNLTLIATAALLTLGACATPGDGAPPPVNPLARYSLQVEPGVDRIALAVHDDGLSANQRAALSDLAGRYADSRADWLRIEAPAGEDPAASAQAYAVKDALQTMGVPGERIMVVGYSAPDPRAPILAGFAVLLGVAIERQQADARFQDALQYQALLTREMSHRVKNSLTSIVGLLRVQARSIDSQDVKNALEDASLRVSTIAEVHDHLWRSSHIGYVELADFMAKLCKKLRGHTGKHALHCHADPMLLSADHAIPLGLLINELVTNAVKYAYPEGSGDIEVSAREIDGHLHVEVSDHGAGLPEGFDIDQPRASLGFKIVSGMVRQLRGHLTLSKDRTGTRFLLDLPILPVPKKPVPILS